MSKLPTADFLNAMLQYDPKTGYLYWREREVSQKNDKSFNSRFAGTRAGTLDSWGHRQVKVLGTLHLAHRIIWTMVTGKPPVDQIDHRDGDRDNNAWANLREASALQNSWNRVPNKTSRSGLLGVTFRKDKVAHPWAASIQHGGKRVHLGFFATPHEAKAVYDAAFTRIRGAEFRRD